MRPIILHSAALTAVLLAATTTAHAGPCSSEIAQMQSNISARLEQIVAAGPTAPQVAGRTPPAGRVAPLLSLWNAAWAERQRC